MSKGILMVAVLEVESEYFKTRDYSLTLASDDATYAHTLSAPHQSPTLGPHYQLFPLTNHLELTLHENPHTDTRHAYFKIPMAKLYDLPKKNHLINVRCVWVEKADGKITEEVAATVRISVVYDNTAQGRLEICAKEAELLRDTDTLGRMDPFFVCRIGGVEQKSNVIEEGGRYPKWNEKFTFILETIPSKISFAVMDKDVTDDDVVGTIEVNPQQQGYFLEESKETQRKLNISFQGKAAGTLTLTTQFFLNK